MTPHEILWRLPLADGLQYIALGMIEEYAEFAKVKIVSEEFESTGKKRDRLRG